MSEILISIKIEPLEEGGYLATSDDIQGLIAQGRTIAETIEIAQDVAKKIFESCIEHGDPDKAPFFDGERGHWEITQGTTIPNHPAGCQYIEPSR